MSEESSPSIPGGYSQGLALPSDTESIADSESILKDLEEKRQLIEELLQNTGREGDIWYLIPADYLRDFLKLSVDNFDELETKLGPVNCQSIVDSHGNLYPENNEPVGTYNVPPKAFNLLVEWFGIEGNPVARSLITNEASRTMEVERNPPLFYLHQLVKKPSQYHHPRHKNPIIRLSKTKTFNDLLNAIRNNFLEIPQKSPNNFRIWFIESKTINEFSIPLSLSNFFYEIQSKRLVHPGVLHETLKSQGVNEANYHILIEQVDRVSQKFPIDNYLNNLDLSQYEIDNILHAGGNLGLQNLGNTCYMNSALQCLLHIPEINYYFLYNIFRKELNLENPLGNHGEVANSFGSLLKQLFDNSNKGSSIPPREFKSTIGHYSSMFSGYLQQDSQEFLSWLLDALHEDLNRIYQKPYCEKPELKDDEVNDPNAIIKLAETCWNQHTLRNDSVITDLFTGLYQSTLVCPDCSKTSITFDPFNDLTLPLPISKKWYHTFTVVDLSDESKLENPIMKLEVELNKNSNYDELLKYLSNFLKVPTNQLFLFEIFRNSFYTDFQVEYSRNKFLPINDIIKHSDEVHVYIIPHDPDTDLIIPILNSVDDPDKSYNVNESFGIPLFIVLNKETEINSFGIIRKKLEQQVKILSKIDIEEEYNKLKLTDKKYFGVKDFPLLAPDEIVMVEKDDNDLEEEEGYNSDISLANPYVSASLGFEIKYLHEDSKSNYRNYNNRHHFNSYRQHQNPQHEASDSVLNVPLHKPSFNDFKLLANELPELKRNYYHYPDYEKKLEKEMDVLAEQVNNDLASDSTQLSSTSTEDGFVLINNESDNENLSKNTPQQSSSDEDTECEPQLGSLYDSTTLPPPPSYSESLKPSNENSPIESTNQLQTNNHPALVNKHTILLCDWDSEIFMRFFYDEKVQNWKDLSFIPNPELEKSKAHFERQRNSTVSLYDCLNLFSAPEVLGEHDLWYCPRCKDHKQATKTISIWSTGDILTIHLKRFHSARAFSDKIDMVVDFPIEGLNISDFISNPKHDKEVYDLIAVDNHYGGLGGGHYTASVKNFKDDQWYYFNDSRVTKIDDPKECVSGAAYLLFYRKRTSNEFLGGENLINLINNGREIFEKSLNSRRQSFEQLKDQIYSFAKYEDQAIKETELNKELEQRKEEALNEEENYTVKKSRSPPMKSTIDLINDENDNIRKQRLISKENNNSKLIQIKNNGKQEISSSTHMSSKFENNVNEIIDGRKDD